MSNKGKRLVFNPKLGKFEEGQAAPWQPPEQLRGLPSEWVTKDTSDPDRIHELDAPHIVEALSDDLAKAEQTVKKPDQDSAFKDLDLKNGPFDQRHIDVLRFKALRGMIKRAQRPEHLKRLYHVWFKEPKLSAFEMRRGRPPLPRDRPRHLKDKDLILDCYSWPQRVIDALRSKGIETPDLHKLEAQMQPRPYVVLQ